MIRTDESTPYVEAIDISYAFSASKSLTYQFICISFSLPLTSFRFTCDELHTVCRLPNFIVIFHGYKYELRASDELRNDCWAKPLSNYRLAELIDSFLPKNSRMSYGMDSIIRFMVFLTILMPISAANRECREKKSVLHWKCLATITCHPPSTWPLNIRDHFLLCYNLNRLWNSKKKRCFIISQFHWNV